MIWDLIRKKKNYSSGQGFKTWQYIKIYMARSTLNVHSKFLTYPIFFKFCGQPHLAIKWWHANFENDRITFRAKLREGNLQKPATDQTPKSWINRSFLKRFSIFFILSRCKFIFENICVMCKGAHNKKTCILSGNIRYGLTPPPYLLATWPLT